MYFTSTVCKHVFHESYSPFNLHLMFCIFAFVLVIPAKFCNLKFYEVHMKLSLGLTELSMPRVSNMMKNTIAQNVDPGSVEIASG